MNEQKKTASRGGAPVPNQAGGGDFARGVMAELRRVTWPTRDEWVSATVLTIALVVGIGLFTWGIDQLFAWLFSFIHPVNI
ncbi:MAG TPA: preprotein translocase subunit SecE [Candidatus Aquilonibacter sp.]|nr:preprotein translocase subunit SecE [Candidatus Aquilonibacter sp.]